MATTKSISSKFSLTGKSYIVTGGAMGIGTSTNINPITPPPSPSLHLTPLPSGYAITSDIAQSGGNVAVLDLLPTPVEDVHGLAQKFGVVTDFFQADVSDEQSLTTGFEKAVKSLGGRIDGIVTAAGIAIDKAFVEQRWEEVERVVRVNVSKFLDSKKKARLCF